MKTIPNLKGDDESRALTVPSSVPSSTDDGDPDDDETGGDKKPPLPTTSRRRNASQKALKATQSSELVAGSRMFPHTYRLPKPPTKEPEWETTRLIGLNPC